MDILGRLGVCERASIDECYLDLTAEARKRLSAAAGRPQRPVSFERVHVCTEEGPVCPPKLLTLHAGHAPVHWMGADCRHGQDDLAGLPLRTACAANQAPWQ